MSIRLIYGICCLACGLGVWGFLSRTEPEPYIPVPPAPSTIQFNPNYETELIHYATVDHSDELSRNLYITPQTLDALKQGDPLPDGTQIVIVPYLAEGQDSKGRWIQGAMGEEIHVSERRSNWRIEDLHTSAPSDWNFASFRAEDGQQVFEDINDCFSCHEGASSREFVFSLLLLNAYLQTGEVQYQYCPRPNREICR